MYTRDGLDILPGDNSTVFNQYVTFRIPVANVTSTIYLVYRPPTSTDMAGLINLIQNVTPNSILIGDFNIPGIDWHTGRAAGRAGEFLDAAEEKFLEQLVDFPTHTKGNTLDLVLTNSSELVTSIAAMGRIGKSDHEMLLVHLAGGSPPPPPPIQRPDWNKANWDAMRNDLAGINWHETLRHLDTEETWLTVKAHLEEITRKYVPVRKLRPPNRPIWMNREISRAMARKRRLWRRNAPTAEYREAEKKVRNLVRNAKRNFEKKLAKNNGNSKPFYSYLKNKTTSRTNIGPLLDENGTPTSDSKKMAKILNNFFASVFTAEDPMSADADAEAEQANTTPIEDITIKTSDTRKLIKNLKTAGSPGPDKITARLLQQVAWEISPALTILFRKSLTSGIVPADWKMANVTPIFKKGKKTDPGNYRPVSLTSICGKLMEGHLKKEITAHLKNNNLLRSTQHGFLTGKSCTTNLLHFLEILTKAVDEGHSVDVVFLDFSKAFDKVPHKKLIKKLEGLGISGKISAWIGKWLDGRRQRVVIDGESSDWEDVKSGVPQGSLLGPVLFSVYLNDIDLIVELITMLIKFADDTKAANIIRDEEDRRRLQQCLDALMAWAAKWGMAFNAQKCKVMHIGRSNPQYQYKMGDHTLETTTTERDIGVLVSNSLKPSDQCAKAAMTANAVLGQIGRAFHYRDRWTFVKLYKLYVRPHLEFAVAAWSPWTVADIESLEKVQKRAVNMVSGLKGDSYAARLKELSMPTLKARREETDMVEVFKIMSGISDVDPQAWFTMNMPAEGGRTTRQAADPLSVRLAPARLEIRKNFFSVRVCEKWNNLPHEVKQCKNVKSFKTAIRRYMENHPA